MIPTKEIKKLRAFNGDKALKSMMVKEVKWHIAFQNELGIPEALAKLQDSISERMPKERALKFPLKFMRAIPVGANLSLVAPKFIVFVLEDCIKNADDNGKVIITKIIGMWGKVIDGKPPKAASWLAASSAARLASRSAGWLMAGSASRSASEAAAMSASESATMSAASSAAWSAGWSAVWSASDSASEAAAYGRYANKLIKLLKESSVK